MAAKDSEDNDKQPLGPSVLLGVVGAVVVLLLLGTGIWGVGKIISKIRESREDTQEEQVAEEGDDEEIKNDEKKDDKEVEEKEEETEEEEQGEEGEETEEDGEEGDVEGEETSEDQEDGEEDTEEKNGIVGGVWVATDYVSGDIKGNSYTVKWGDTLWEIAEARYGSGFQWKKILNANLEDVGFLSDGSRALIFPGQVLALP